MDDRERDFKDVRGSASLIHNPTGLYVSVAGGIRDDDVSVLSAHDTAHFHYTRSASASSGSPMARPRSSPTTDCTRTSMSASCFASIRRRGSLVIWGTLSRTEVVRWGAGIEQAFDDTGLLLYAQAHRYEATIIGFPCDANPQNFPNNCGGDPSNLVELPTEALGRLHHRRAAHLKCLGNVAAVSARRDHARRGSAVLSLASSARRLPGTCW